MKSDMREIAEMYGVGFKDHGDKIEFYIHFNPDFEWHKASLLVWWKNNPEGGLNWWTDYVFDGKHRISGPGYPAYAIQDQDPISYDRLLAIVNTKVVLYFKSFKQYENRI